MFVHNCSIGFEDWSDGEMPEGGETIPLNLPSSEKVRAVYIVDNNIIKQHPDYLHSYCSSLMSVNTFVEMKVRFSVKLNKNLVFVYPGQRALNGTQ